MPINPDTGEITPDRNGPRMFSDILPDLSGGQTNAELAHALHRLIEAVQDTEKSGKLTLVLDVAYDGTGQIVCKDSITVKLPEHDRGVTKLFVGRDGNPRRINPNQPSLLTAVGYLAP